MGYGPRGDGRRGGTCERNTTAVLGLRAALALGGVSSRCAAKGGSRPSIIWTPACTSGSRACGARSCWRRSPPAEVGSAWRSQFGTFHARSSCVNATRHSASLLRHGASQLPLVDVDTYNEELRDDEGFVGDRASRRAFRAILEEWRERIRELGEDDPLGAEASQTIPKKTLDTALKEGSSTRRSRSFRASLRR